jgi:FkbM family methyltransferase
MVRKLLEKLGHAFIALSRAGARGRSQVHREWLKADGDRTLRVDYPLDQDSIVVDVGGYRGDWASDIFSRYCCRIHIVEPLPGFVETLRTRFQGNPSVEIHALALGAEESLVPMATSADASSLHKSTSENSTLVPMTPAGAFLSELNVDQIDLMKVNIEGSEYDLIDDLHKTGWLVRIRDLQIQFHDFVPDAERLLQRAERLLEQTHERTYHFKFVWDNWRLREHSEM